MNVPSAKGLWEAGVAAAVRLFTGLAVLSAWQALPLPAQAGDVPASGLRRVSLQLPRLHQMQFAGFYTARELGYYREAGLEVEIRERRLDTSPVDMVVMGQADFGISALVMESALHGMPLVALAALSRHSPYILLVPDDAGIRGLGDLAGRTILTPNASLMFELEAMLAAAGVVAGEVRLAPLPHDIALFGDLRGASSFCHRGGLPGELEQRGIPFTVFHPRDYGVDAYGELLFTSRSLAQREPGVVRAFREASLRGWHYALDHQEETVGRIQDMYAPGADRARLGREAQITRELMVNDTVPLGYIDLSRWNHVMRELARLRNRPFDAQGSRDALLDTFLAARARRGVRILKTAVAVLLLAALLLGGVALVLVRIVRHRTAELARANLDLRESESLLRSAAEGAIDGVALMAPHGRYLHVNTRFAAMYGYPVAAMVGRHFREFVPSEEREDKLRRFACRVPEAHMAIEYESHLHRKDGSSLPIRLTARKVEWRGQPVFSIVLRDLSESKRLEQELLHIGEWERIRIGQDLHDTIGQQLAGMAYLIEVLARNLGREQSAHAREAMELAQVAGTAHTQLREVVQSLLPLPDHETLDAGLERVCALARQRQGVACRLSMSGSGVRAVKAAAANHLLNIAREAIANAIRHGNARHIEVALRLDDEHGLLSIEDDGSGFDPGAKHATGSGLRIMGYRADVLGGRLDVRRRAPGGMAVVCTFDLAAVSGIAASPPRRSAGKQSATAVQEKERANDGAH